MLGKLFGFRKDNKPATPPQTAAATPKPPKTQAPSLLEQLANGQPVEDITDHNLLHQLVKHSDKLDKKTNRLVRERIQALKEQERQQQQLSEKQEKICTRLETLSRLQHHPLFDSELAHLQQQWQAVTGAGTSIDNRVQVAIVRCQQIQQEATIQQEAAQQAETQRLLAEQAIAAQDAQDRQQAAVQEQQQEQQQEQRQKHQQQSQADREKHEQAQREIGQTLQQQLQQLETAIEQADSKKARELHDRARDNLKKLDPKQVHEFDGKLHLLSGQLRDLQDWQAFAALPKLEALCADMEKLADTGLPPLQKADSVRELQNQWRAMKPPSGKPAQALWNRFKQASDKAWEPCAEHFDKEKKLRAFNLQQRQAICDALEQFYTAQNWDKADWKAVARILDKARQEFHDFHPVERNDEKGIRARFDAALGAINAKLLVEQQANEERKRQLVETASSIATMTDLDKAAERVRQIQEQWKQIGLTRRHEDQKLWQALQEQTAIVFDKRRANQQQQRQAQHDQTERARNLCEQIAALAKLPDAELAQSGGEFDRLQAEYKSAITDIPEKNQQAMKKTFYTACDSYRHRLAGIGKRQHALQLQELARRAQLCVQLETDPSAARVVATQEQWQQHVLPVDWERDIETRRQRAVAAAEGSKPLDYHTNEAQLRELCIALEILLDAETPAEDRQRRRDYQLRRLQQGLGQGTDSPREQLERLLVQWYCASAAAPDVQQSLQARFDTAQKQGALAQD